MTMLCKRSQLASYPESVSPARPQRTSADSQTPPCYMQAVANEAVTLRSAALPDLVCTALTSIAPDQPIAVLPLGSMA